jgi:predicted metal-binding protein
MAQRNDSRRAVRYAWDCETNQGAKIMAVTTCAGCGGRYFEMVTAEPANSRVKINMVQCAACGIAVSTMEYYDAGSLLKEQEAKLAAMDSRLVRIERYLAALSSQMR